MKYFIDFEATQFSEEIISVGCVREDGETFYSLVHPVDSKITPFITNLTGITAEMVETAMSPDAVFEKFYDWMLTDNIGMPDFYVWGNSDVDFLRHTFRRTVSMKARIAIGYMSGSIINFAKRFCKKIDAENCALIKAYNTLVDAEAIQTHNALDDAVMLAEVYRVYSEISTNELKEKMSAVILKKKTNSEQKKAWNHCGFPVGTVCIVKKKIPIYVFENVAAAADWLVENEVQPDQKDTISKENMKNKIRHAYASGKPYFGYNWRYIAE